MPPPRSEVQVESTEEGTYLSYSYPKLPWNTDFETFRKTDKAFKNIIEHFNNEREEQMQMICGTNKRKERFIFSAWPRDPKGPVMGATLRGKDTGNGCILWGPTLYDFYRTQRIPNNPHVSTISTGSKLATWVKSIGELDAAKLQIRQAEMADEPYEMQVFNIGKYIEVLEEQVWKGRVGKPLRDEERDDKKGDTALEDPTGFETKSLVELAKHQCLYPPSTYPPPWPLKPFSVPLARLQHKLPPEFLPRRLIVHDPWRVLELSRGSHSSYWRYKWGSKPDIVRIYNLKLEKGLVIKKGAFIHQSTKSPLEPECPLAHLYITPNRQIGKGNHSFVFQVELELPRELLMQPKLCFQCALDKSRGGDDVKVVQKRNAEEHEKEPSQPESDGPDDATMQRYYSILFKNGEPFEEKDRSDFRFSIMKYLKAQRGPHYCKHLERDVPAPPSQKASVIAKLSLPDDNYGEPHCEFLAREARNYQNFPSHMFEHWNGYNVIHPMHEPTPVGAVVPQFYGYYVPDKVNEPVKKGEFMSPILLLEHCGQQVDPYSLTSDDKRECFSLLRRLHLAGFVHHSVYQRNIVTQYGPLMESPFKRSSLHPRFRLIDFGRSYKCDDREASREMGEEVEGAFRKLGVEVR